MILAIVVGASTSSGKTYEFDIVEKCRAVVAASGSPTQNCQFTVDIPETITKPAYVYIGYKDFFVNHRNVKNSVSLTQLSGSRIDATTANSKCTSKVTNADAGKTVSYSGSQLQAANVMTPCGLRANLYVEESVIVKDSADVRVNLDTNNIIASGKKGNSYANTGDDWRTFQWMDIESGNNKSKE